MPGLAADADLTLAGGSQAPGEGQRGEDSPRYGEWKASLDRWSERAADRLALAESIKDDFWRLEKSRVEARSRFLHEQQLEQERRVNQERLQNEAAEHVSWRREVNAKEREAQRWGKDSGPCSLTQAKAPHSVREAPAPLSNGRGIVRPEDPPPRRGMTFGAPRARSAWPSPRGGLGLADFEPDSDLKARHRKAILDVAKFDELCCYESGLADPEPMRVQLAEEEAWQGLVLQNKHALRLRRHEQLLEDNRRQWRRKQQELQNMILTQRQGRYAR